VGRGAGQRAMIAVIMSNGRAFRSHHDPGIMIAWIKGECLLLACARRGRAP
jgi:hypothetical protein